MLSFQMQKPLLRLVTFSWRVRTCPLLQPHANNQLPCFPKAVVITPSPFTTLKFSSSNKLTMNFASHKKSILSRSPKCRGNYSKNFVSILLHAELFFHAQKNITLSGAFSNVFLNTQLRQHWRVRVKILLHIWTRQTKRKKAATGYSYFCFYCLISWERLRIVLIRKSSFSYFWEKISRQLISILVFLDLLQFYCESFDKSMPKQNRK
jgi:hypothetical protein